MGLVHLGRTGEPTVFPVSGNHFHTGSVVECAEAIWEIVLEFSFVFPTVLHFQDTFALSFAVLHIARIAPFVIEEEDVGGVDFSCGINLSVFFDDLEFFRVFLDAREQRGVGMAEPVIHNQVVNAVSAEHIVDGIGVCIMWETIG